MAERDSRLDVGEMQGGRIGNKPVPVAIQRLQDEVREDLEDTAPSGYNRHVSSHSRSGGYNRHVSKHSRS